MRLNYELILNFLKQKEADNLKIPFIKQFGKNTCWAACYKMVDSWRYKNRSICEYVNLQTKNCNECFRPNSICDKARPVAKVWGDWQELGYKHTLEFKHNLTENEIRRSIKKKHPIQAFIKFRDKEIGHYILIVGIEKHPFTADSLIAIMDPTSGYTTRSLGELFQWGTWQYTWVIQ